MMDAKADVGKFATASIIMPHDHGFATKVTDKLEDLIGLIFLPIVSPLALRSQSTHRLGMPPARFLIVLCPLRAQNQPGLA